MSSVISFDDRSYDSFSVSNGRLGDGARKFKPVLSTKSKQEIVPELKSQQAKRPRVIQIRKTGQDSRNKGSCEASVQSDHDKDLNIFG